MSEADKTSLRRRQERLSSHLAESGVFACVIEDFENLRNQSLRWLTGHPTDAILFAFASGRTVLVPWDVNLARDMSFVDQVVPYTDFRRSFRDAVGAILRSNGLSSGLTPRRKVEVSGRTRHLRFIELSEHVPEAELVCRNDGIDTYLGRMRMIKDPSEIQHLEKACEITNALIARVEELMASASAKDLREFDMAQLIEREALALGAEGLGFETLAAGPGRSYAIHPFPAFSNAPFGGPGLSILDFGVKVAGYTSDVTLTVARGNLDPTQEKMISLVEEAYAAAVEAAKLGASPQEPAKKADEALTRGGWKMPHALGHGIGLDAHEDPLLRSLGESPERELAVGMVFTIEPGLYHPQHGGVRWENDVLIAENGARVLTKAKIIRIA